MLQQHRNQSDYYSSLHRQSPRAGEGGANSKAEAVSINECRNNDKLRDKVAFIGGGDDEVGCAIAVQYARQGADIVIVYSQQHDKLKSTQQWVEGAGRKCLLIKGDFRSAEFCRQAVKDAIAVFNRVDILVNNVAEQYSVPNAAGQKPGQEFEANFYAYFYLTQAALPYLRAGSVILNTTSAGLAQGSEYASVSSGHIPGSINSDAVLAFTLSLAKSLAAKRIRVNGVAAGIRQTLVEEGGADRRYLAQLTMPYVFLASEEATDVTGRLFPCGETDSGFDGNVIAI